MAAPALRTAALSRARAVSLRLTLVTMHPHLGDKAHNAGVMEAAVKRAKGDIVAFPEMALSGYVVRDRVHRLAEPFDGPSFERFSKLAADTGKWILYGFPRVDDNVRGLVYNSAALVDPDGEVQIYDKRQLATFGPFEDGLWFTPGRSPGLFATPWGTLGVSICYDLFFPELTKAMALAGADVLLNISASPNTSRRFFEALFPARAIENAIPVAYTNFVGAQENLMFWGGAQVWGPRGTLKARSSYHKEEALEVEIDHEETRAARPLRPTLRDSRRESAEELLDQF